MADYYDGQITLMGINDSVAKVTFNATLREGYTRTMLADTIAHYCAFMVAVRDGVRQLDKQWGGLRPNYEYSGALMAHDYLINLWGGSKSGSMNYFTESTTAQDALNFYWQCKDDLAAIDLARVLEVANQGEQPATLQPDTPYPVPNATPRVLRDGEYEAAIDILKGGVAVPAGKIASTVEAIRNGRIRTNRSEDELYEMGLDILQDI